MHRAIPLLVLGDDPASKSGLGRIGRDLASLISRMPEFRVGYLARGGRGSRQLPFAQYTIQSNAATGEGQWGEWTLPEVWRDFAGDERGVLFSIWDASRLFWLARPEFQPEGTLRDFLSAGHFARWGYFAMDAAGPFGKHTSMTTNTLKGYDRVLTYSRWAKELTDASGICNQWLPHGMNTHVWVPQRKDVARAMLSPSIHRHDFLVGVVATNQARKDWGLVCEAASIVRRSVPELRLWFHVDTLERHWSIPALLADFGLTDITTVTHEMTDSEMAYAYSACDVTVHPGAEGFGYPLIESMACGTPVVHGNYAGGPSLVQPQCGVLVEPVAWRLETLHNAVRPVYVGEHWAAAILSVREREIAPEMCRASVEFLDWKLLWPSVWKKWFLGGLR